MIGIKNQYMFKFSIGEKDDFITNETIDHFIVTEEAGNSLPAWKIAFKTKDPELPLVFNEGNDFKISFGTHLDDLKDVQLVITKRKITRQGISLFFIEALGLYSGLSYITSPVKSISSKKSGVEVMISKASSHFKVESNVTASQDSQYWIQPNTTDKAFVDQLWLHSYLANSFLGTSITFDGKFLVKDIKKAIGEDYKFRFVHTVKEEKDIIYTGDYELISETGFINSWVGYGKEKLIHKLEDGTKSTHLETIEPLLALTKKLTRRADIEKRSSLIGVHNENTHDKYWQAALRNVMGMSIFSSERNTLSFDGMLNDIHPLDVVMFKDTGLGNDQQSAEFHSGLYLVGAVGRSLNGKNIATTVDLYRESFNSVEGELR